MSDSGASKFMDAMPLVIFTQTNDQQYKSGVWNYLGLSLGPVNPGSLRCQRGPTLTTHTHVCTLAVQESVATTFAKTHGTEECSAQACPCASSQRTGTSKGRDTPLSQGYGNIGDLLGVSLTRMV